ncbi:unnamed protein product [Caenorhabditis sp. 36 PRJEB53466]|nr:unnamed protein product [Caenorhabditis sp. 36 PRJEB53466]
MIPANVQLNRESPWASVREKPALPKEIALFERPGWRMLQKETPVYDLSVFMNEIRMVFRQFKTPSDLSYEQGNTLSRLEWALRHHRKKWNDRPMTVRSLNGIGDLVGILLGWMKGSAEWVMHAEGFRKLPVKEKFGVLLGTWQVWTHLERLQLSIEVLGERAITERLLIGRGEEAIDMRLLELDISPISKCSLEQLLPIFTPFFDRIFDDVGKQLLELRPSSLEVTFMLCYVGWTITEKLQRVKDKSATDLFINSITDELHEHYTERHGTSNYAARLIRMTNIVNKLEVIFRDRRKLLEIAKLFDVFKTNISEPCIFE